MKRVIYSGKRVFVSKITISVLLCFGLCISTVWSQITYLSAFDDPTGKYNVSRPSCTLNLLPPSISDPENVSTSSLTDFATLRTTIANATLACNGVYLVNANLNLGNLSTIEASPATPYYAGFKVSISSALLTNLIGGGSDGIIVRTYLDGLPVQNAGAGAIGLSLLQPNIPGNISFSATQPFNQVAVELSSGLLSLGLASSVDFYYGYASTSQVPIILPVKLMDFSATIQGKGVAINWTTASETNLARYELQRSSNGGTTYNTITTIAAKGNTTSETKYNFVDATAITGSYTYRLKMIDKDGDAEYSKLALIKLTANANWKIYPTLLNNGTDLNVNVAVTGNEKTQVQLANLQGQTLRTVSTATNSKLTINTSGLSAGVYMLKLYQNGQLQASEKVVIQ